jgi:plasmid maintenance system antidote protein VapI
MQHCYILTQLLHLFITKFTTGPVMHKLFSTSQNCTKKIAHKLSMYPGNTKKKWLSIQIQHQIAVNILRASVLNDTTLLKHRITRVTGS